MKLSSYMLFYLAFFLVFGLTAWVYALENKDDFPGNTVYINAKTKTRFLIKDAVGKFHIVPGNWDVVNFDKRLKPFPQIAVPFFTEQSILTLEELLIPQVVLYK